MANRIESYAATVRAKLANLDDDVVQRLDTDISHMERAAYQNRQAMAFAQGVLTQDEAATVYRAIGEVGTSANGGWPASTDTAMKVAVTKLIGELMGVAA